jgi:hypothetical protein
MILNVCLQADKIHRLISHFKRIYKVTGNIQYKKNLNCWLIVLNYLVGIVS